MRSTKHRIARVMFGLLVLTVGFVPLVLGFISCFTWNVFKVGWELWRDIVKKI